MASTCVDAPGMGQNIELHRSALVISIEMTVRCGDRKDRIHALERIDHDDRLNIHQKAHLYRFIAFYEMRLDRGDYRFL